MYLHFLCGAGRFVRSQITKASVNICKPCMSMSECCRRPPTTLGGTHIRVRNQTRLRDTTKTWAHHPTNMITSPSRLAGQCDWAMCAHRTQPSREGSDEGIGVAGEACLGHRRGAALHHLRQLRAQTLDALNLGIAEEQPHWTVLLVAADDPPTRVPMPGSTYGYCDINIVAAAKVSACQACIHETW